MTAPPKRRWFRFGLRTMFVVVTLAAIPLGWLAWQIQIVHHRQAMRKQIEDSGGAVLSGDFSWQHSPAVRTIRAGDELFSISRVRRRLGDERVGLIAFNRELTSADRDAIQAFPEAQIDAVP